MSVEQLEQSVLKLDREERRRFAEWFYQHEMEILAEKKSSDWEDDLSEEQKAEILRRRELCEKHPELLEPWEGTTERLRVRLHEIRAQKTATRRS